MHGELLLIFGGAELAFFRLKTTFSGHAGLFRGHGLSPMRRQFRSTLFRNRFLEKVGFLKVAPKKRFQVGTQVQPFVSFKHWKEMCKRFPRLVLPFKKLQYSWCTLFMGVKWWDSKKNDLEKARSKIKKDMGLEKRRKLAKEFLNEDGGGGDESTDEDDED